jgi:capsular polysaccharide transport system permease protein
MKLINAITPRRLTIWLFAVPMALTIAYYGLLAAPRYVSESVVAVRDTSSSTGSTSTSAITAAATMFLGATSPMSLTDLLYLQSYIQSDTMMTKLDAKFDLRKHYTSHPADVFYSVWPWMTHEQLLDFYRSRVGLSYDEISGLLTIDVEAFDPEFARQMALFIVAECNTFVNGYAHAIARDRMSFAEGEVERWRSRLQAVKSQVLGFQTKNKLLDPVSQSAANSTLTATLQASLAQQEAALRTAQSFMQEDSAQVKTLRSQIEATRAQLDAERLRATASNGGDQLAALTIEYQGLLDQATFAQASLTASMGAVEQARADTMRNLRSVVQVQTPTRPQSAIYPRYLYSLFTAFVVYGMLLIIGRLVYATIREHQD